jgi:hypothetical protein
MNERSPQNESGGARIFETLGRLIGALAWPALILYLFLSLRDPVTRTLEALPQKLAESRSVSMGSFKFELQEAATGTGDPLLAGLVHELSPEAVAALMQIGYSRPLIMYRHSMAESDSQYYLLNRTTQKAMEELEKKGLLDFGFAIADFRNLLASTGMTRDTVLSYDDDQISTTANVLYEARTRRLTPDETHQFIEASAHLTETGKTVFHLCLDTITKSLK